jgi:hypothetical protein
MMLYQPQDVHPSSTSLSGRLAAACGNVIPFAGRTQAVGLSLRDRMEVASWQGKLQAHGCDRMVIHERIAGDPPEVDAFLSIYRRGEAWAHWNLARCDASILVWYSVSGEDVGRFTSMAEALLAVFPIGSPCQGQRASAEIIRAFC